VANQFSDDISVLLGNGDGTFAMEARFGVGGAPRSVAIGDLDGDGREDLAVANSEEFPRAGPGDVSVLLGNGDGTFAMEARFGAGDEPSSIAIGDFDGDGREDPAPSHAPSSVKTGVKR